MKICKTINSLFLICILLSPEIFTQNQVLTVLAASGKPLLHSGKKAGFTDIIAGMKIDKTGTLQLSAHDYCALTSSSGGTLELSEAGSYSFADLIHRIAIKKQSVTKRVTDYLAAKLVSGKDSKGMKSLGAVVRASRSQIAPACPKFTNVIQPVFHLTWYHSGDNPQYIVHVLNDEGKTVYVQSTTDSSIVCDITQLQFLYNAEYRWFFTRAGKEQAISDTVKFKWLDDRASRAIVDSAVLLTNIPDFANSAIGNFSVGMLFESHQCNVEAAGYFVKAVELSSGATTFLEYCLQFLMQTGQDRRAYEVYNKYSR